MTSDKTGQIEYCRLFLLEDLPSPLTRASAHIQIFDNYLPETRLRLRSIRIPETNEWRHALQQRIFLHKESLAEISTSEINLNELEYEHFKVFEGNEIRKNRYYHEFDARLAAFDLYLGPLWGLNRMRIDFDSVEDMRNYVPPAFALLEVTNEPFFDDANLVNKNFEDIRDAVSRLNSRAGFVETFCASE